jgi:serine phosphatase RsbU (regulator of sigma subunit)
MRILYFILFLLCFFNNQIFSQNISELEASLTKADDEDKAYIYNQLSELYVQSSNDRALEYGQLALKKAKQINDLSEEAMANVNLANAYKVNKKNTNAITCLNNAAQLYINIKENSNLGIVYSKLTDLYVLENDLDQALKSNKLAKITYLKLNDKKGLANCLLSAGDIICKQKKIDVAIANYNNAKNYYQSINDEKMLVKIYARIGNANSNFGDFANAKINLTKALYLANKNNLNQDAQTIEKSLEVVAKNEKGFRQSQTIFSEKEKNALILKTEVLENKTDLLINQNNISISEIEKLSIDNQVSAYKIKAQKDELLKTKIVAESKAKQVELLKKETELSDIKVKQQKTIILIISISLVLLVFLIFIIVRSLAISRKQKNIIQLQKAVVDEKQRSIISGINAASIIQTSILPKKNILDGLLKKYFVLYMPKDIVSGDFYWAKDLGNDILFAVVDCTGHGVPGAFMSLHGYNLLERIVTEKNITQTDTILNELNTAVINTMADEKDEVYVKNGMDMSLIKFNKLTKQLEFCGANNNLFIARNGLIIEIKSDKMSIGHIFEASFTIKKELLQSGDILYLYTDGYKDQKGGGKNKSFLANPFKKFLEEISMLQFENQLNIIKQKHVEWKGTNEQTDDICLVGIQI